MRQNKMLLTLLALTIFLVLASAARADKFPVSDVQKINLLNESEALRVDQEAGVTAEMRISPVSLQTAAGFITTEPIRVNSKDRVVVYEDGKSKAMVSAGVESFPISSERRFGFGAKVGYGQIQRPTALRATVLHLIPIEGSVVWRLYDIRSSRVSPYARLGMSYFAFQQRGIEEDNVSGGRPLGVAGLGFIWGSEKYASGRDGAAVFMELRAQREVREARSDFSGSAFFAGLDFAL